VILKIESSVSWVIIVGSDDEGVLGSVWDCGLADGVEGDGSGREDSEGGVVSVDVVAVNKREEEEEVWTHAKEGGGGIEEVEEEEEVVGVEVDLVVGLLGWRVSVADVSVEYDTERVREIVSVGGSEDDDDDDDEKVVGLKNGFSDLIFLVVGASLSAVNWKSAKTIMSFNIYYFSNIYFKTYL
jgi:hypothetical protein